MIDEKIVLFLRQQCLKVLRKNHIGNFKVLFDGLVKYNQSDAAVELSFIGVDISDLKIRGSDNSIRYLNENYPDLFEKRIF